MDMCIQIHTCKQQQLINKKAINLKDSGEGYIGEYGGIRRKGKMQFNHYLKNKQ